MTRHFELFGGNAAKFWTSAVTDTHVDVRYGRSRTYGQVLTKSSPDATAAQKHADELIAGKLVNWYRETAAV
jgi:predicted DNA-binding WGR domain protein